jgi:hypothetical protein
MSVVGPSVSLSDSGALPTPWTICRLIWRKGPGTAFKENDNNKCSENYSCFHS